MRGRRHDRASGGDKLPLTKRKSIPAMIVAGQAEIGWRIAPPPRQGCRMMERERFVLVLRCGGLGDCLFAIPVIKKIHAALHTKYDFEIYTYHVDLFRACPYVVAVHPFSKNITLPANTKYLALFNDQKVKHWEIDTFDYISLDAGLGQLSFREKRLEYFPAEPDQSERFDVVINTSRTWPSRSWPLENWQRLADHLVARGLKVAVVGKDIHVSFENMFKQSPPLAGCANLVNQLSLDQTYYTIKNCGLYIGCQNGLSVLAGTTDTEIIVLDMSIEWSKRAIYRNEDPHYRVTYAKGTCPLYCCAQSCPLPEPDSYRCQPSFEAVAALVDAKLQALTA
jgi:ADP-heptose:LPS heptosyltransferase